MIGKEHILMIGPRVTLIFEDGTKKKIELYDRPPVLKLDLRMDDGEVLEDLHFVRNGPDEYRQRTFGKDRTK